MFLDTINYPVKLSEFVRHSRTTVLGNYVIAKPPFWQEWLQIADKLFDQSRELETELGRALNAPTRYLSSGKAVTSLKTFVQERIACLVLSQGNFSVGVMDMSEIAEPSAPFFAPDPGLKQQLKLCDALKRKYDELGDEKYLGQYRQVRESIRLVTRSMNAARTLREIHTREFGKVSDKWESNFDVYERVLAEHRMYPVQLLEIGVQNGGSLEMWATYFENALNIIGCDVNPLCATLTFDDKRIVVVIGNFDSNETEERIARHSGSFDIVIDDGSHLSSDIIRAFWIYFSKVKPGGLYIVEDTHTLYFESYEGGILRRNSAYEMFKLLADVVNQEHWNQKLSVQTLLSTFFPTVNFPAFLSDGWIESIEFANSIVVIRKAKTAGSRLGQRLISGNEASVNSNVLKFRAVP